MEWMKKFPAWISSAIGLATLIIGFVVLVLNNLYLGITISVVLILLSSLCLTIYLSFSKKNSEIIGGRAIDRFPMYRRVTVPGALLIILISIMLLVYKPSRSFAVTAFVVTATPTEV